MLVTQCRLFFLMNENKCIQQRLQAVSAQYFPVAFVENLDKCSLFTTLW